MDKSYLAGSLVLTIALMIAFAILLTAYDSELEHRDCQKAYGPNSFRDHIGTVKVCKIVVFDNNSLVIKQFPQVVK